MHNHFEYFNRETFGNQNEDEGIAWTIDTIFARITEDPKYLREHLKFTSNSSSQDECYVKAKKASAAWRSWWRDEYYGGFDVYDSIVKKEKI